MPSVPSRCLARSPVTPEGGGILGQGPKKGNAKLPRMLMTPDCPSPGPQPGTASRREATAEVARPRPSGTFAVDPRPIGRSVPEEELLGVDQDPAEVFDGLAAVGGGGQVLDGGGRLGGVGVPGQGGLVELPGDLLGRLVAPG